MVPSVKPTAGVMAVMAKFMTMKASAAATASCRSWGGRATGYCDIYMCLCVCSFMHARLAIRMMRLADNVECSLTAVDILRFPFQDCRQCDASYMFVYIFLLILYYK